MLVYADKIDGNQRTLVNQLHVYVNNLRREYVTSIPLENTCTICLPYLALASADDESQSRRQQRPIISNLISTLQHSTMVPPNTGSSDETPTFSAAAFNIKQSLTNNNQTLYQIREASAGAQRMESQLSFKTLSPKGKPLPADLTASLSRSRPIVVDQKKETQENK